MTSASTSTFSASSLMARAMPTISSAVSPLTRSALRKAAVWASPARPPMISSSTSRASSSREVAPGGQLRQRGAQDVIRHGLLMAAAPAARRPVRAGHAQERRQQVEPHLGQHALGVELHAVHRQLAVTHAHHDALGVPGGELEAVGQRLVDDQRVVAGRRERVGQAGEHAARRRGGSGRSCRARARPRGARRRRRPGRWPGGRGRRRAPAGARRRSGRWRPC